jgi:5-methylcytosine-specific restriction endonuclease McrA
MDSVARIIYKEYIKGDTWRGIRAIALQRDKKTCQKCGSKKRPNVHHLEYPKELGTETLDMLITLCEDCHNIHHGGSPRSMPKHERIKAKKAKKKGKRKFAPHCKVYTPAEIAAYQASR